MKASLEWCRAAKRSGANEKWDITLDLLARLDGGEGRLSEYHGRQRQGDGKGGRGSEKFSKWDFKRTLSTKPSFGPGSLRSTDVSSRNSSGKRGGDDFEFKLLINDVLCGLHFCRANGRPPPILPLISSHFLHDRKPSSRKINPLPPVLQKRYRCYYRPLTAW